VAIDDWKDPEEGGDARNQVMVFRYNGKFVAVNHVWFLLLDDVGYASDVRLGMPPFVVPAVEWYTI
jgi:hypothetical protein